MSDISRHITMKLAKTIKTMDGPADTNANKNRYVFDMESEFFQTR